MLEEMVAFRNLLAFVVALLLMFGAAACTAPRLSFEANDIEGMKLISLLALPDIVETALSSDESQAVINALMKAKLVDNLKYADPPTPTHTLRFKSGGDGQVDYTLSFSGKAVDAIYIKDEKGEVRYSVRDAEALNTIASDLIKEYDGVR